MDDFLSSQTTDQRVKKEILAYTKNKFVIEKAPIDFVGYSFLDEDFVETWYGYVEEGKTVGFYKTLQRHFAQLHFPIEKGISNSEHYKAATLKDVDVVTMEADTGLALNNPDEIEFKLYNSIAGKIPVLIVPDNEDFESIVQAFCYKNEPVVIPKSMGATMVHGINNWGRIRALRSRFKTDYPIADWNEYFKSQIMADTSAYQDKMIILSTKPYSNVLSDSVGLTSEDWIDMSLKMRLHHEIAHYFTLRRFSSVAHNLHNEIVADYAGICAGYGRYNPEWFLKFMGLEDYPNYRKGGRLENYLSTDNISEEAYEILKTIIFRAAINIYKFDDYLQDRISANSKRAALESICRTSLLALAEDDGADQLYRLFTLLDKKEETKRFCYS